MKHISKFNFEDLKFGLVTNNKGVEYIDISSGFDIEVSNVISDGTLGAFMYIFMVQIGVNSPVYFGRTWEELTEFFDKLSSRLSLSPEDRHLPIYVHNLAYEFQFIRKHFNWVSMFALAERKPLKCVTSSGIEFRCSYLLSGYSLAKTAENLRVKIPKLEGDLDYKLVRNSETPLTPEELNYCRNDVLIVTKYIEEQREIYGDVIKIPNTNTGRVRKYVKDACYFTDRNHKKTSRGKFNRYRRIMNDLTLTPEAYNLARRSFIGGFTHANALYSGKILKNVTSIDFTSSYPSVMLSELFPMGKFEEIEVNSIEELVKYCDKYCLIFEVEFNKISSSFPYENYLSESKCSDLVNPLVNNGRIVEAESLKTVITEVDFDIISEAYTWKSIRIGKIIASPKGYLPKPIVDAILTLYEDKTRLKDVEGSEVEYMLSKGMLNSVYGMSVTDIMRDEISYEENWIVEPPNIEEKIKEYNESMTRFLFYPWGIWVTAYARRNLWTGILAFKEDYIYSDTDSIKLLNYDNHKDYINWFNRRITDKLHLVLEEYRLDTRRLSPKTIEGVSKPLGVWDYEGTYPLFKTLGAKRYAFLSNGKFKITVAGLNKVKGADYLTDKAGSAEKAFNLFNNEMFIPKTHSGRLTHTYIDSEIEMDVVDYLGKSVKMNSKSGVHLDESEFTLSIGKEYIKFLRNLSNGIIYKGEMVR